jgi:hypothetical protein
MTNEMSTVGLYSAERAAEISRLTNKLKDLRLNLGGDDDENKLNGARYVQLTSPLAAASDPLTGYTQANFTFLNDSLSPENRDMQVGDAAETDKVTNRNPGYSASIGDILLVVPVANGDEWAPMVPSSSVMVFGILGQDSGADDVFLPIQIYQSAYRMTSTSFSCGPDSTGSGGSGGSGSGSGNSGGMTFADMNLGMCSHIGTVTALVPAGYKAGPVGLLQGAVCSGSGSGSGSGGSGSSEWDGWVVIWGRKLRCVFEAPKKVECCPITGLRLTRWARMWFFGGALPDRFDPCPTTGSGGSGS